jgi:hypothetical protein
LQRPAVLAFAAALHLGLPPAFSQPPQELAPPSGPLGKLAQADAFYLAGQAGEAAARYARVLDDYRAMGEQPDELFLSYHLALLFAGVSGAPPRSARRVSAAQANQATQFLSRHLLLLCARCGTDAPSRLRDLGDALLDRRSFLAAQAYDTVLRDYPDAPLADYCAFRAAYSWNAHFHHLPLRAAMREAERRFAELAERYPQSAYRDDSAEELGRIGVALLAALERAEQQGGSGGTALGADPAVHLAQEARRAEALAELTLEAETAYAACVARLESIRDTYAEADRLEGCLVVLANLHALRGDTPQALDTLHDVLRRFPRSSAARAALGSLGVEAPPPGAQLQPVCGPADPARPQPTVEETK